MIAGFSWIRLVCAVIVVYQHAICVAKSEPLPAVIDPTFLNHTVQRALSTFNTPGMSIAVIQGQRVLHQAGYGVTNLQTQQAVDAETYFRIASTSKAFTAASVAMLVDKKVLLWDDRVVEHLPEFHLADPFASNQITLRDLLSHRSGLGSGMGDSMLWPEPAGFSRSEIVHNLRYLTPQFSFRSQYAYSNVMYIAAAEIVANKVNQAWHEFVDASIFQPLSMDCYAGDIPAAKLSNAAMPYAYHSERGMFAVTRNRISEQGLASAAAGGIVCNATGMTQWLQHLIHIYDLGNHATPPKLNHIAQSPMSNVPLFSSHQLNQMWSAQTVLKVNRLEQQWNNTVLKSYGLGWRIANVYGHKFISHTGTLSGFQAYVGLLPDLGVGIAILNNGSNSGARGAVMQTLLRQFIPEAEHQDWVSEYQNYQLAREQRYLASYVEPIGSGEVALNAAAYLGRFKDRWFGHIDIGLENNSLRIQSSKMPTLLGTLKPFEMHTWVIEWDNKNAANNAFIDFQVDTNNRVTGFQLRPYTSKNKINYEWSDMFFHRL